MEIKDILAYVKWFLNPHDHTSLKRIINTPSRKVGDTTMEKISEYALAKGISHYDAILEMQEAPLMQEGSKLSAQANKGIKEFLTSMNELQQELPHLTPSAFLDLLVKRIHYRDHLVKEEGSEQLADERYDNVGQLINMASKYVEVGEEALRQFMEEVSLLSDVSENEQGELDAVKLMTVHSSKGLEFAMVFVVGLEEGMFPLSNAVLEEALLEEERRLMYVAITRAKDVLFLSCANARMTRGQTKQNPPSRFLSEIPASLVKSYDLGGGMGSSSVNISVSEGDTVKHKLFGTGYVFEVYSTMAVVKFHNPKFGLRKVELRFLEVL